jgi:arylsulfatase A
MLERHTMNSRHPALALALAMILISASLAAGAAAAAGPASRPNFVFILVDDMGWADVGCNGSTFYDTPARLNLTNYLVGLRQKADSPLLPAPYKHHMDLDEVTLAEALKPAGYATGHVGKWHLGPEPFFPQHQGFDVNIAGTAAGMPRGFFYPKWKENVPLEGKDGDYLTDRLTDEALRFIQDNKGRPFFLYLAFYAVHIPIEARPDLLAKYQAKKPGATQDNAHYAAMVETVDQNVGRVLDKLKELKIDERTVVVFTSDNGGLATPEGKYTPATNNAPLRSGKGNLHEGGIREPLVVRWPGKTPPGSTSRTAVSSIDFYPTFLEIAGVQPPAGHVIDGISLVPLLAQSGDIDRKALYWHYPHFSNQGGVPAGAVRAGDHKLIEYFEDGRLELYNLKDDIGESRNLAASMPDKAAAMKEMLAAWRKEVGANMPIRKDR